MSDRKSGPAEREEPAYSETERLPPDSRLSDTDLPEDHGSESSTAAVDENAINAIRMRHTERFTPQFLALVAETELEYGYSSPLDDFLRERLNENASVAKEWLTGLFLNHIADIRITTGILRTIAHLDYEEIAPNGLVIAMAALSDRRADVRECGIRAFENWATLQALDALKTRKCPEKWMQNYVNRVIANLEKELGVHASTGEKD